MTNFQQLNNYLLKTLIHYYLTTISIMAMNMNHIQKPYKITD